MAGIGFQLHKLIEDESFLKKAKAYIFASIITSGPWILSILCLAMIGILSGKFLKGGRFSVLSITVVYTFAFSLILTGPIQFVLTRYLADKEYLEQRERMFSALVSAFGLTLIVSLSASVSWYVYNDGSILYKTTGIILFVAVCSIWTMMDFLSCSKRYQKIIASFFFGSLMSLILAPILGLTLGMEGSLIGYTTGQLLILILLIYNIAREFPLTELYNREFFRYLLLFPYIFFTGLFYNLGLWIDKLIGWVAFGDIIFGNFKAYSLYDTPIFIAYLSIIPSLAYFLIQSETRFYLAHRAFFDSITHESLNTILKNKDELISILNNSLKKLFLIQFATSLIGSLCAGLLGIWFDLLPASIVSLRILFFAAGAQVLFLYIIIFLMYFDLAQISFYMVALFFLLNLSFNILQIYYPAIPMGTGYLFSIVISFLVGFSILRYSVSDIEYTIFIRQEN